MSLREYARKRRFARTPEPDQDRARRRRGGPGGPIFVVQLHDARARHYDFRLEVDGALRSWAVPKGPSLRAGEKRLAVEVEDHPLAYADFSGDIPAGEYGAGHVDVFDRGTWSTPDEPLAALARGHLDFELHGKRLRGRWTLVRTRSQRGRNQWLLIKRTDAEVRDAEADDLLDERAPARKRRTRTAPRRARGRGNWRARALALPGARDQRVPPGFAPQLCTLRKSPPAGDDWLHETKWDGYRLLVDLVEGHARLRSRNDIDWTARFPSIAQAVEALPVDDARLDGELVALDADGHADFAALQGALDDGAGARLRYVVFDLPGVARVDLRKVALAARKALLADLLEAAPDARLAFSSDVRGHGGRVFAAASAQGLEGIVSKAADAAYVAGRSHTWVKVKRADSDEFVVVGFTDPKGARRGFGSLLLAGVRDGALVYAGRVGSGFGDERLQRLARRLQGLERRRAVLELPAHVPLRASAVHWVEPRIVVEVAFRGRASEGLLRQATFLRVRDDKNVEDLGMPDRKRMDKATGASRLTHADRVVFADGRVTKQDIADYYREVAPRMLPELVARPLSILRCPDGADGTCFFQKHHAAALGAHVASIPLAEKGGARDDYLYVKDLRGVLELVQMNVIEFHPWGARIDAPDQPDRLVFDLDPAPGIEWKAVVRGARDVRDRLAETGLESFVRLSGGKGVHVVVPIRRGPDWAQAKAFCEAFAQALATRHPERYIATASKRRREGRIFIDWLRNARGATSVASWSLRARAGAPVAMPIRWDELGRMKSAARFDLGTALRRARSLGSDPWDGFAKLRQRLPTF